jgi:hypothetical protein
MSSVSQTVRRSGASAGDHQRDDERDFERGHGRDHERDEGRDHAGDHERALAETDARLIDGALAMHRARVQPRLGVLWSYYRNPIDWSWWRGMSGASRGGLGAVSASADGAGELSIGGGWSGFTRAGLLAASAGTTGAGGAGGAAGAGGSSGAWSGLAARGGLIDRDGRLVRSAQERGLPGRFWGTGQVRPAWSPVASERVSSVVNPEAATRREVVIENDIAWRVHAMVDFLFNRPIKIVSTAVDGALRSRIERALEAAWEASGGMGLLQDAALLGHVYGWVDLRVRWEGPELDAPTQNSPGEGAERDRADDTADDARLIEAARRVKIELVEPRRGVGLVDETDYRRLDGYVLRGVVQGASGEELVEVLSAQERRVYRRAAEADERDRRDAGWSLVGRWANDVCPGAVPVVHVQNVSQPFVYAGLSEVEPLMALQDELNTRLSDRANRVTMQSFKMYLAKGVDGFDRSTIAPGTVWTTDNPDAEIKGFGGDASSPSEESHIAEVRAALDKASSVPPLATGVVQAKVGNLSSENALRLTLQGLLAKTERKRLTYGRGVAQLCAMVLQCLDLHGALRTRATERGVVQVAGPSAAAINRCAQRNAPAMFRGGRTSAWMGTNPYAAQRSTYAAIVACACSVLRTANGPRAHVPNVPRSYAAPRST